MSNVLLKSFVATLLSLSAGVATAQVENSNMDYASNETLKTIFERTSIRQWKSTPVEYDKVQKLLRAAMSAPTAMNRQPWDFIVLTDSGIKNKVASELHNDMVERAPLVIITCGNMTKKFEKDTYYWLSDVSAATENMLLAAKSLGLGAVWTGGYPSEQRVAAVRKALELPEEIVPVAIVPIGYPAEDPLPKDKWQRENVHYNGYGKNEFIPAAKIMRPIRRSVK